MRLISPPAEADEKGVPHLRTVVKDDREETPVPGERSGFLRGERKDGTVKGNRSFRQTLGRWLGRHTPTDAKGSELGAQEKGQLGLLEMKFVGMDAKGRRLPVRVPAGLPDLGDDSKNLIGTTDGSDDGADDRGLFPFPALPRN